MTTIGQKRRRITVPLGLENVRSLNDGEEDDEEDGDEEEDDEEEDDEEDGEGLPLFLANALAGDVIKISHEDCPFEEVVDLNDNAWGDET